MEIEIICKNEIGEVTIDPYMWEIEDKEIIICACDKCLSKIADEI